MSYKGCGSHRQWLLIEEQITSSLLLSQLKISVLECKSYKGCCSEVLGLPLLGSWHWEIWGCVQSNVCWHQNLQTLFLLSPSFLCTCCCCFKTCHGNRIISPGHFVFPFKHSGALSSAYLWGAGAELSVGCLLSNRQGTARRSPPFQFGRLQRWKASMLYCYPICLLEGAAGHAGDTKQGSVFPPCHSSLLHLTGCRPPLHSEVLPQCALAVALLGSIHFCLPCARACPLPELVFGQWEVGLVWISWGLVVFCGFFFFPFSM